MLQSILGSKRGIKSSLLVVALCLCFFDVRSQNKSKRPFANDYWSWSTGPSSGIGFEHIHFLDNGSYLFESGYSGGAYFCHKSLGNYRYNVKKQQLRLQLREWLKPKGYALSGIIKVVELTDSTVTLESEEFRRGNDSEAGNRRTYHRSFGYIPEQKWECTIHTDSTDWELRLNFDSSGQLLVDAFEVEEEAIYQERSYVCYYHMQNNVLYLNVMSEQLGRGVKINSFEPSMQTCVRIDLKKKQLCADDILFLLCYNKREQTPWRFAEGEFSPNAPLKPVERWVKLEKYKDDD